MENNKYIDLRNMPSIELLNFEGPVLKAIKAPFGCVVVDQWEKTVAICNKEQLEDFISGKTDITDSNNKTWNYPALPCWPAGSIGSIQQSMKELSLAHQN